MKTMNPDFEEGFEYTWEDPAGWSTLAPVRGQVIEVHVNSAGYTAEPDTWAAFLIVQVSTRLDGSVVLLARHLGCEDQDAHRVLEEEFNVQGNSIHLCLNSPCLPPEDRGNYLHAIRCRLWTLEFFKSLDGYVRKEVFRKTSGWLKVREKLGPKPPSRTGKEGPKDPKPAPKRRAREPKAKDGKADGEKAKAPRRSRKGEAEEKKREDLRQRLKAARQRLQGAKPGKGGDGGEALEGLGEENKEDIEPENISSSPGQEDESLDFALGGQKKLPIQDHLNTGTAFPGLKSTLKGKDRTKKADNSRSKLLEDVLGDFRNTGPRSTSGQLLTQAMVVSHQDKKKKKQKKQKQGKLEKFTSALTELISDRAPKGKSGKDKDRKEKKEGRKRRRVTLRDGTIVSCSSSSEEGSSQEEEEEKVSSDSDLEAPLRKKSRDKPGSVLNLLVRHVQEQMDQSALTNATSQDNQVIGGIKVLSFFNLFVKGAYPTHLRELREMFHLATCVDLLRQGQMARLGDSLSARFMAIHQSLVDSSWATAKHLEIHPMEETTAAGPATILATRKHAKLVEKVQASSSAWPVSYGKPKGSRGKGDYFQGEYKGNAKGDGKGKTKGKKGKGKGGKQWNYWDSGSRDWDKNKERQEEKPKNKGDS